jgi:two-component system response regulator CpxR
VPDAAGNALAYGLSAWQAAYAVSHPRGRSVLVVDDDDDIREVIAEILRAEGYDVTCASNGAKALEELHKEHHPDLVLLDLMMPIMSGWEVLEEIQGEERLARIPVVVVSAMHAPGACEHLAKPVDLERLLSTVGRLTG